MYQASAIKKTIFIPLSISLILLLALMLVMLFIYYNNHNHLMRSNQINQVTNLLKDRLNQDHNTIDIALQSLADDKEIQSSWLKHHRTKILNKTTPIFQHWRQEHRITHLYFINPERLCFLRVHQPNRHGDIINRFTMLMAEKNKQKVVYGIELGPLGTFTLRVVMPWFIKDQFVGYLEGGQEIEHITDQLSKTLKIDLAVSIKKEYLNQARWTEGMKMMERDHYWESYPNHVISSQTAGIKHSLLSSYINHLKQPKQHGHFEIKDNQDHQTYEFGHIPLFDFGKRHVGDLIIQNNITLAKQAFYKTVFFSILIFFLVGTFFILGFSIYLNQISKKLVSTQIDLQNEISERMSITSSMKSMFLKSSQILASIPSILIGINQHGKISEWNAAAEKAFNLLKKHTIAQPFAALPIPWDNQHNIPGFLDHLDSNNQVNYNNVTYITTEGTRAMLDITITRMIGSGTIFSDYLLIANDVTENKALEAQLVHSQKLESIGQLAAGIAHEINTPIQYVGDNIRFFSESFSELKQLIDMFNTCYLSFQQKKLTPELTTTLDQTMKSVDLEFLMQEIPDAVKQSLEGVDHVATIVRALKGFAHPDDTGEMIKTDVNLAIKNTITVARNEWKYVADVETVFDPTLPLVDCYPGEFNQVILNLIINAAHAIGDVVDHSSGAKGTIIIQTDYTAPEVRISIRDSGPGIPDNIRGKIFNPFFTTKEVGKGTGQGLAIAHSVIVEKHGGKLTLDSILGDGTTFYITLPIDSNKSETAHA